MKEEIKIPSMGESISEATIGTIIKPAGSQVAMDDEILELETDKVNQVLYAPHAGVISYSVNQGDTVKIGQVIGYVDTDKAAAAEKPKEVKAAPEKKPEPAPTPAPASAPSSVRVTKEVFIADVKTPQKKEVPASSPAPQVFTPRAPSGTREETRRKIPKIRKIIAERLVEVQQTTAMLTTFNEVDMSAIIGLREKYKEDFQKKRGVKLGFMSFFIKAAVSAMQAFPDVNSYIDGDEFVHREYYDIGIAVGTERGLIVPVLKDCDKLSFPEIEGTLEVYAKKAREGALSPDLLRGGGFTITNGGVYGSLLSTPILNPPQCAILGMHKIMKRAVVVDDQIVSRPMMYLALSYDHRIIDGKEAVSFLVHLKNCLEDPSRLLLDL